MGMPFTQEEDRFHPCGQKRSPHNSFPRDGTRVTCTMRRLIRNGRRSSLMRRMKELGETESGHSPGAIPTPMIRGETESGHSPGVLPALRISEESFLHRSACAPASSTSTRSLRMTTGSPRLFHRRSRRTSRQPDAWHGSPSKCTRRSRTQNSIRHHRTRTSSPPPSRSAGSQEGCLSPSREICR